MARKILILRSMRPLEWTLGAAAFLCLILLFCPWLWKSIPDGYFAYSGTVVDKGREFHFVDHILAECSEPWSYYIIVENERGGKKKKYVTGVEYIWVDKGTYVVKRQGFGEMPLRPGQKTPGQIIREHEQRRTGT